MRHGDVHKHRLWRGHTRSYDHLFDTLDYHAVFFNHGSRREASATVPRGANDVVHLSHLEAAHLHTAHICRYD